MDNHANRLAIRAIAKIFVVWHPFAIDLTWRHSKPPALAKWLGKTFFSWQSITCQWLVKAHATEAQVEVQHM